MKVIAVFLSDETTVRRLTLAFRNRCAVRQFGSLESSKSIMSAGNVLAIVVDMRQRGVTMAESTSVDLIAHSRAAWPAIPIVGYVDFTPHRTRDILAAAHAGATEIILGEFDDLDLVANRIVDMGTSSDAATRVAIAIRGIVPSHLHDFFLFCVVNARHAMSVDSVVTRLHRSRKTLSNWLAAAQLPPPSRIVGWARILVAARMLGDTTRSTEKIACDLHFVSGTALRNMMRRYLGCGPEALRQRGGFEYALSVFIESLRAAKRADRL